MKERFVADLVEGMRVDSVFALAARELRSSRGGTAYLWLELGDRTGRIPAVLFRPDADASAVPVGSAVRVAGTVTSYRGVRRVSVDSLRACDGFDRSDLLAEGPRDRGEMLRRLERLASLVRHPALRALVTAVLGEPAFRERFAACPASQTRHHAYLGGLLEHTVAVAELCLATAAVYDAVDRDLLLAAALLHDVGKVDELAFDISVEYTDAGRLLGHVVLGERRVRDAAGSLRQALPEDLLVRLSHVLLAHHGELEWGSPKRPAVMEALLLHHADNLDAKAKGFLELVSGAVACEERWTDASNLFRRPLYAPRSAEDDRPRRQAEDDEYLRTA